MTTPYDPLEGVTAKTTKDELLTRLRKAAATIRRDDNKKKARLAEIESNLRAKFSAPSKQGQLKQAIFSDTEENWKELIEFLEEFEDLLPIAGQRIVLGGQVLLGLVPSEPDPVSDAGV